MAGLTRQRLARLGLFRGRGPPLFLGPGRQRGGPTRLDGRRTVRHGRYCTAVDVVENLLHACTTENYHMKHDECQRGP